MSRMAVCYRKSWALKLSVCFYTTGRFQFNFNSMMRLCIKRCNQARRCSCCAPTLRCSGMELARRAAWSHF